MLLTDIYYQATDMEARALRGPSWAKPYNATGSTANGRGPRLLVGHALIGLGFLVAGLGMAGLTLLALLSRTIRRMGMEPALDEAGQTAVTDSAAPQPAAAG